MTDTKVDIDPYLEDISKKAVDIFDSGREFEKKRLTSFLTECANRIDFQDVSPQEIILELIKIYNEEYDNEI